MLVAWHHVLLGQGKRSQVILLTIQHYRTADVPHDSRLDTTTGLAAYAWISALRLEASCVANRRPLSAQHRRLLPLYGAQSAWTHHETYLMQTSMIENPDAV